MNVGCFIGNRRACSKKEIKEALKTNPSVVCKGGLLRFRVFVGPMAVKRAAEVLREADARNVIEGTEHVLFDWAVEKFEQPLDDLRDRLEGNPEWKPWKWLASDARRV